MRVHGRRRSRQYLLVVIGVMAALLPTASATLARFTDSAAPTGSFTSDTLAPPTSLAATGGAAIGLSWAITPDTYATGYGVYRSATSGGTTTLVATVTPRTATTTTDAPGNGTWFYVLRSQFQSWRSVASNQASATVGSPITAAYATCASNAADTTSAGNNNGYESNPTRACADDSSFAVDATSGNGGTASCGTGAVPSVNKDRHRFWGFATGVPGTASTIEGIRVRADLATNNNGGTTNLCAQLSWDGGTTWTSLKTVAVTGTAETTYTFGGVADTWGRTWTVANLASTALRVRIVDAASQANKSFSLDYVAVSVTYRP
jgi:hypothetical protein